MISMMSQLYSCTIILKSVHRPFGLLVEELWLELLESMQDQASH